MNLRFDGKNVLVVGGSSGIGNGIAQAFRADLRRDWAGPLHIPAQSPVYSSAYLDSHHKACPSLHSSSPPRSAIVYRFEIETCKAQATKSVADLGIHQIELSLTLIRECFAKFVLCTASFCSLYSTVP